LLDKSFFDCARLSFIEIPKSVCFIGEGCFHGCSKLTEVIFESPATVQRIESHAFSSCENLTSFTVPSSVSTLGDYVFSECRKLSSVTFDTQSQLTNIPN
jgi:hypothetical protein